MSPQESTQQPKQATGFHYYNKRLLVFLCSTTIIFTGVAYYQTTQLQNVPPAIVVEQKGVRRPGMYPNPLLTPGDVFPNATKEIICVTGYTKTVRNVSLSLKKKVYAAYNTPFPQPSGTYELDHFIPLALGGSNDPKNLWPEPAFPRPGFKEKDVIEVYLLKQVCQHGYDLKSAQEEVRKDWYSVYERIPNRKDFTDQKAD